MPVPPILIMRRRRVREKKTRRETPLTIVIDPFYARLQLMLKIRQLQIEAAKSKPHNVRISRACGHCGSKNPLQRAASTACGHAVCRECADAARDSCPICKKPCVFIRLFEDDEGLRDCCICLHDSPSERAFFQSCGHLICRLCSLHLQVDAYDSYKSAVSCPFCRTESFIIQELVEEVVERRRNRQEQHLIRQGEQQIRHERSQNKNQYRQNVTHNRVNQPRKHY